MCQKPEQPLHCYLVPGDEPRGVSLKATVGAGVGQPLYLHPLAGPFCIAEDQRLSLMML